MRMSCEFLGAFTFVDVSEIECLADSLMNAPEKRDAQRRLAREVTAMVHGVQGVQSAERISSVLFGGDVHSLTREDLQQLALDGMSCTVASTTEKTVSSAVLAASPLARRKRGAQIVESGGVRINGTSVVDVDARLDGSDGSFRALSTCSVAERRTGTWCAMA